MYWTVPHGRLAHIECNATFRFGRFTRIIKVRQYDIEYECIQPEMTFFLCVRYIFYTSSQITQEYGNALVPHE